jgi:hypothetical protein
VDHSDLQRDERVGELSDEPSEQRGSWAMLEFVSAELDESFNGYRFAETACDTDIVQPRRAVQCRVRESRVAGRSAFVESRVS